MSVPNPSPWIAFTSLAVLVIMVGLVALIASMVVRKCRDEDLPQVLTDRFRMNFGVGLGSRVVCRQDVLGAC